MSLHTAGISDKTADERSQEAIHAVFEAVARDQELHGGYVLKGGLALWLVYGSPRRSTDLDYNAVETAANVVTEETGCMLLDFCRRLDAALKKVAPERGFETIRTDEVVLSSEIPVLLGQFAYAAKDGTMGSVPMQVTLSEIVCQSEVREIRGIPVHIASLEDILSEKLKALLQQVKRDKIRSIDVFDLWYFTCKSGDRVRPEDITPILLEKRKQWPDMPPLAKSEYRQEGIVAYAEAEYELIEDILEPGAEFVPFDEAYDAVLDFVDRLRLPE